MDTDLRREIDARAREEQALIIYVRGQDEEASEYAAGKLIKLYSEKGSHGALLNLGARLPPELRKLAELAIVDSVPVEEKKNPGVAQKRYGILLDLAFDPDRHPEVRVAAGTRHVERLFTRMGKGDDEAKKEIGNLAKHRRMPREVKTYIRNTLDAIEIAAQKKTFKKPNGKGVPSQGQKQTPATKAGTRGSFVP